MSSGRTWVVMVLLVLSAVLSGAGEPSDEDAVLQAVQNQLRALGAADLEVVRASFAPYAVVSVSRWTGDGWQQSVAPAADRVIARMAEEIENGSFTPFVETIQDPQVTVTGGVAQVTASYQLAADSGYTASGVDMWQLALIDGQWQVTALAYSHRATQPPGE